jgi:6-phosphogluconolactonase
VAATAVRRQPGDVGPAETRRLEQVFITTEPRVELRVFGSAEDLAAAAAAEFAARAQAAVSQHGRFTVALCGGSTPNRLYALLAERRRTGKGRPPWGKIHVFWGDERVVPPGHSDSNFHAANEALLAKVPIPQANVHRIRAEARSPAAAAALYEQDLTRFFSLPPGRFPRFDLVLLGLGADGHTASLFPGSEVLLEQTRLVAAPLVPKLGTQRITLTLPVLNSARAVMFLVSGGEKAEALARALEGGIGSEALPPRLVRPRDGEVLWLVDQAASRMLHGRTLKTPAPQPRQLIRDRT